MNKLHGSATLFLEDGSFVAGEAILKSLAPAGKGYLGTFRSETALKVSTSDKFTTMIVGGVKFRVAIARTDREGVSAIEAVDCL